VAEIRPFKGIRYAIPQDELAKVIAPPYDVIPPAYQDELYARDPRNIVRVELNRSPGEAAYEEAGETYRQWRQEGLLAEDPEPSLYVLEQSFPLDGRTVRRFGLLARFRAEDPEKKIILPHEQTRAAAREDRIRLLRATKANLSPLLLMFPDTGRHFTLALAEAMSHPPLVATVDDAGIGHRVWRVTDSAPIAAFQSQLAAVPVYIADGHHRHATALRYRDETGPEGAWTFGYFTPIGAPGLVVLPYHRILSEGPSLAAAQEALRARFRLSPAADVGAAARAVAASAAVHAFALAAPGQGAVVAEAAGDGDALLPAATPPSLRALDTYFLHQAVLGPMLGVPDSAVSYVHSLAEAEEAVAKGRGRLVVLLRGTPVRQIMDVSEAGESMPAKSTFFHPKLPAGLVIHPLAL
jgi:uncharacterized protein (DUF1015 family)